MTPRHHPSEATLVVFAAGGLSEGMTRVVSSHLVYCNSCGGTIAAAEAVGGALLDEIQPEAVSALTRRRVVSRLERELCFEHAVPAPASVSTPAPLREFLEIRDADDRWRWFAPGVRHLHVTSGLQLVRVAPGRSLPTHGHTGSELTLVLDGAFADEFGRFALGDVAELDDDTMHRPVADRADGCLCLLASDGPFKPTGWLARTVLRWSH